MVHSLLKNNLKRSLKKPASLQIKINTLFAMEIIRQVTVDNSYFLKSVMMIEKTRKTPKNEFTRSTEFSDGANLG